jgi:hypothetical protein
MEFSLLNLNNIIRSFGRAVVFYANRWDGASPLEMLHLGDTEGDVVVTPNATIEHLTTPEISGPAVREADYVGENPTVEIPLYLADPALLSVISPTGLAHAGYNAKIPAKEYTLAIFPEPLFIEIDSQSRPHRRTLSRAGGLWLLNGEPLAPERMTLLGASCWLWRGYFSRPPRTFRGGAGDNRKNIETATFQGMQHEGLQHETIHLQPWRQMLGAYRMEGAPCEANGSAFRGQSPGGATEVDDVTDSSRGVHPGQAAVLGTKGKIDSILDQVRPNDVMYLINAIYFKASWLFQFREVDTEDGTFHNADGSEVQVPMMRQGWAKYDYLDGDGFAALRLPYMGDASMYIFLPDRDSSLPQFLDQLDGAVWNEWIQDFREGGGEIVLPRFELEYDKTMNDVLSALGMEIAFGGGADFSDMGPSAAFISRVVHKAVVEVHEKGTEAAAATMVAITDSAPALTFEFIVDRPFFFAITDDRTGNVLFMGTVQELGE